MAETRQSLLNQIHRARAAHKRWLAHVTALAQGLSLDQSKAELDPNACDFGRWYTGTGHTDLGHLPSFAAMDDPHRRAHIYYAEIVQALEARRPRDVPRRLRWLRAASEELIGLLAALEDEARAMPMEQNGHGNLGRQPSEQGPSGSDSSA